MRAACARAELARLLCAEKDVELRGVLGPNKKLVSVGAGLFGYETEELESVRAAAEPAPPDRGAGPSAPVEPTAPRAASGQQPSRAHASFLRVVAVRYPKPNDPVTPVERAPWDQPDPGDPLDVRPAAPLVNWPRLWRRLRPLLSRRIECREVDVPKLVDELTRGEPILGLPRLVRCRFEARVRVLADRSRRLVPFWTDQIRVGDALERWMVRDGHQPRFVRENDAAEELLWEDPLEAFRRALLARRRRSHRKRPIQQLELEPRRLPEDYRGRLVLLLGDLGAYGDERERERWEEVAHVLQRSGAELRALVPCPPWRLAPRLARLWNAVPWDAAERRAVHVSETQQRERSERLLTLVAPSVRIEPGLLRAARALLPQACTDSGTEADVAAHPGLASPSSVAYTLDEETLRRLRDEFKNLPQPVRRRAWALIEHWHKRLPRVTRAEEQLGLAEHCPDLFTAEQHADLRAYFLEIAQAFGPGEDRTHQRAEAVESWFHRFEARAPDSLWQDEAVGKPLRRVWALLHRHDPAPKTPPGFDAAELEELTRGDPPAVERWRLWQVGHAIVALPSGDAATAPPAPRPGTEAGPTGSPIAELTARAAKVHVAEPGRFGQVQSLSDSHSHPMGLPRAPRIVVSTNTEELTLAFTGVPPWAQRAGRDEYGLWAEFELRGVVQRMRWIRPGRFWMGSPESEPERFDWEFLHEVELTRGYWLGDTACTQALWHAVMGKNPSQFEGGGDLPVDNVSWSDCRRFIERANAEAPGLELRLPTEAEWEHACRAGTRTPFSFGENVMPQQVNYDGNYPYAGSKKGQYRQKTVPVRSLPANPWGLYEMHGNLWEWCEDWCGDYKPALAVDPRGPDAGAGRVLRGGSWGSGAWGARSADRYYDAPGSADRGQGFRLARGQEEQGGAKRARGGETARDEAGEAAESERSGAVVGNPPGGRAKRGKAERIVRRKQ